jgi:hypothetical protein
MAWRAQAAESVRCAIGRAIDNHDDLEAGWGNILPEDGVKRALHKVSSVISGDDDRDFHPFPSAPVSRA